MHNLLCFMLLISILSLILSNAVVLRRDLSILFNRITIIILLYCILHEVNGLFMLNKGISLHGGLLYITNITQIFHIFIFFISILILQLTSFYPRKSELQNILPLDNYYLIILFIIEQKLLIKWENI